MDQSYWSISDILADSARIPCSFNIDVPNLAHLAADASVLEQQQFQASQQSQQEKGQGRGNSDDAVNAAVTGTIKEKTKLELPFWLVELLALNDIVTPSLPRPYSQRVRNALNADANSVQLRSQSNWWYAVGMRLAELEMNRQAARSSRTDSSPLLDILSEVSHQAHEPSDPVCNCTKEARALTVADHPLKSHFADIHQSPHFRVFFRTAPGFLL